MMKRLYMVLLLTIGGLVLTGCPVVANMGPWVKKSDAKLESLQTSIGSLVPTFSPDVYTYNLILEDSVNAVTITGKGSDPFAILSDNNGKSTAIVAGMNKITIQVAATDRVTKKEYLVLVNKTSATSAHVGKMMLVPAGQFLRDPAPQSLSIIVKPFTISQFEVSRGQFFATMGIDPSGVVYSQGSTDPVQQVNWYQAIAFCNKLSISEGYTPVYSVSVGGTPVDFTSLAYASIPLTDDVNWNATSHDWNATGYRLPTEMEWMWAAMGAEDSRDKPFAGSNGSNSIGEYAVYGFYDSPRNTGQTSYQRSNPAGTRQPNELGIYDLTGNVSEWCWDVYAAYGFGTLRSDSNSGWGPSTGDHRVMRGGSWGSTAVNSTIAFRGSTYCFSRGIDLGFRVVRN